MSLKRRARSWRNAMSHLEQWSAQLEAGEQTDPTLELAARLTAEHPPLAEPPAEFRAALRNQLLATYGRDIRWSRRIAGVVTALLVVGAIVWLIWPRPVSAADILARASAVNTDSSGLQSFQGVYTYGGPGYDNTGIQPRQTFVWYKAPNLRRVEYYSGTFVGGSKLVD